MNNLKKTYDVIVYIGRFQPLHNGHIKIIETISQLADRTLVIVGSKSNPVSVKNPWNYEERKDMIQYSVHVQYMTIAGVEDYTYDDYKWINEITKLVEIETIGIKNPKIAIAGYNKDHTSSYLQYFPQWDFIEQKAYKEYGTIVNATDIRAELFKDMTHHVKSIVSPYVFDVILNMNSKRKEYLINEYNGIIETQAKYGTGNHVATDAIVVQSGHILLIKRKDSGVDLWAMAGGFLDPKETLIQCVIRELKEETVLKVPEKVLLGSIKDVKIFDKIDRDLRSRIITQVYLFKLDDNLNLPKVKGTDDAKEAKWISIHDFYNMRSMMYADHYHIIEKMLESL